jgi:formate dehydrogenase (coenzyme F420) beta subunit
MTSTACLHIENGDILQSIQGLLTLVMEKGGIEAVLVPKRRDNGHSIMPFLINDPAQCKEADPLSPVFALNAAKQVSKLTHRPSGKKIAAVLRPCEIRALIELVKLKQADLSQVVLISIDCLGAYTNKDWARANESMKDEETYEDPAHFIEQQLMHQDEALAQACKVCDHPVSDHADIRIGLFGMDTSRQLLITSTTRAGSDLMDALSLEPCSEPEDRQERINDFISKRLEKRDMLFKDTAEKTDSLEKLDRYFARCINCYNCRVACPVCYCKECVFNTDVFDHDPYQYLVWARRKGAVKLPADTLFFHLTRLAHMSLSCVGCGQCSNACPNDIPVMELFTLVAKDVQTAFDYRAGKDPDQAMPLSEFKEKELFDVVGI